MFITLLFLALVQGTIFSLVESQNENEQTSILCEKHLENQDYSEILLDAEQLAARCPGFKLFMDCEVNASSLTEEVHELENLHSQRSLVIDLCDEDSKLHKTYLASVNCYRSMEDVWPTCYELGQDVYLDYRKFITAFEDDDDSEKPDEDDDYDQHDSITSDEPHCMMNSYAFACLGIRILETCGAEAHDAFVQIIRRSRYINEFCSGDEANKLRSSFFYFLSTEKEHEQIDIIGQIFNFKKK